MNLATIAVRNLRRNKVRTALTVLGTGVAVLAFIMLRTLLGAWHASGDYTSKDRLMTRHKVSFILTLPKRYIEDVRGVPGVSDACYASWFGGKDAKNPSNAFGSTAIEPRCLDIFDEIAIEPDQKAAWLAKRDGAIVGDVLARRLGVKVGDRFTLKGTVYPGDWQLEVSAIYTAGRRGVNRTQLFLHWDYLNDSIPPARRDQIGWTVAKIDGAERGPEVSAAIDRIFDDKDVQTATMSERAMALSILATLSALVDALGVASFIILLIVALILGNAIAMGVRERTREYGLLRVLGFSPLRIGLFVVAEAASMGMLASGLGIALSYPLVELGLGRMLEENMGNIFPSFRIGAERMLLASLLVVGLSVVASLAPAYRAWKLPAIDALRRVA
jgi:putative ABC transport system permease protein